MSSLPALQISGAPTVRLRGIIIILNLHYTVQFVQAIIITILYYNVIGDVWPRLRKIDYVSRTLLFRVLSSWKV